MYIDKLYLILYIECSYVQKQGTEDPAPFETNFSQLVKALNSGSSGAEFYAIVSGILSIVNGFDFVVFGWIPRERNIMADRLAKDALSVAVLLVVGEDVRPSLFLKLTLGF